METEDGLILLTCGDCVVASENIGLLNILSIIVCSSSYCGDSPSQILVKMAELVLCSPDGDERAPRNLFHLEIVAEIMDNLVDIGELDRKL